MSTSLVVSEAVFVRLLSFLFPHRIGYNNVIFFVQFAPFYYLPLSTTKIDTRLIDLPQPRMIVNFSHIEKQAFYFYRPATPEESVQRSEERRVGKECGARWTR